VRGAQPGDALIVDVLDIQTISPGWCGGHAHTGPALVQRMLRAGVVRLPARIPHVGPGSVRAAPAEAADA